MYNIEHISNLIGDQFPDFYKSDGQNFIQFIKAYYEWEEENSKIRKLKKYRDIDDTLDEFLIHFQHEYMNGIPNEILGNKRLLQKHILDLYRSKGSLEGIRLLFRLLFNEEIEYYIPSFDIFKPDDNEWYQEKYIEISKNENNINFHNKLVVGATSNATAIVENYERRNINGKLVDILVVSNIRGEFLVNELLEYDGIPKAKRPKVLGSPVNLKIIYSTPGHDMGYEVQVTSNTEGSYLKSLVTEIRSDPDGIIEFTLIDGGSGYSFDSIIEITAGSNTAGAGAMFIIQELSNTENVYWSNTLIQPYANVAIDANTYDVGDGSSMSTSNAATPLEVAFDYHYKTFGSISKILTTNPGVGYDANVNVKVYDPEYIKLGRYDDNGNLIGNNAIITGSAKFGEGIVASLSIKNSGFSYKNNEIVILKGSNNVIFIEASVILGGVGTSEGYWKNTRSFLDDDKYLQDDYYYQEYSYEVQVRRKISEYYEILKKVMHPAGNQLFGKVRLITEV